MIQIKFGYGTCICGRIQVYASEPYVLRFYQHNELRFVSGAIGRFLAFNSDVKLGSSNHWVGQVPSLGIRTDCITFANCTMVSTFLHAGYQTSIFLEMTHDANHSMILIRNLKNSSQFASKTGNR